MRVPALVRIVRPGNALLSAAGVWAGALLAGAPLAPSGRVAAGMLAAVAFAAAGNVRNDVTDVAVDCAAHPGRPLVTGEVSLRSARAMAVALYAVALGAAALVGWPAVALVAAALVVMEAYERALKARGLPGNAAVALLTGAPFVMGGLAAGRVGAALLAVAALAVLANVGREVLKDAEDAEADRGHRRTLPLRVGARRAGLVAGCFLVAAALLSPLPWRLETVLAWPYLPAVGLADACFLAAAAAGPRSPARGQRLAKAGMALALAAVVVGVA
ncbi:MAG TPA: UbiA family prenyltransferase, partial [Candidatus Thermoplasmatota archaeon]|nr:UbiA family prenyltransferase [Candidatus Thermoplasmatota archaeon]